MVCLIWFEARKIFLQYSAICVLAATLFFNAVIILNQRSCLDDLEGAHKVYQELYKEYGGKITADKIKRLLTLYASIQTAEDDPTVGTAANSESWFGSYKTDGSFLERMFVQEMKYDYLYQNYAYHTVQQAEKKKTRMQQKENQYEYRKQKRIAADYQGRKIQTFTYTEMIDIWYRYESSSILMILMVVYGLSNTFAIERETDMYMLLTAAPKGRVRTTVAKLAAAFLFSVMIGVLFSLEDALLFTVRSKEITVLLQPLYTIPVYQNTPFGGCIGLFFILDGVMKVCGLYGYGVIILGLSKIFRSVMASFITGTVAALLMYAIQAETPYFFWLKVWNPLELIFSRDLFLEERFINGFGYPVCFPIAVCLGQVGMFTFIFAIIIYFKHKKWREKRV